VCPVTIDGVEHEVGAVVISGGATPTPRVFAWVARRQDLTVRKVWEGEVSAASGPRDVLLLAGLMN